ncbi:MAG: HDOD domain-containing protein [Planctomycetota bacterium]|nr:MAG: HDOD domain-containing protein [Planctomycetota bacterium]
MLEKPTDSTVPDQVELVIRRLDSLSILPSVAIQCFPKLLQPQWSPSDLAEIAQADPALSAKILSVIHQHGLRTAGENASVGAALEKLPAHLARDAVFSVKVFPGFSDDDNRALFRRQLVVHCLAVACCAEDIAGIASYEIDSQLAYAAGLLHDIGKLALDEVMPRSFAGIIEQAKSQQASTCTVEQQHLGTDHTLLGKRLAAKWHLPNQIMLAIWLHHSDTSVISEHAPDARIAQIVQLADLVARQCNIGQSGSYDSTDSADRIASSLAIDTEHLEQIRGNLAEKVRQKSAVLALDLPNAAHNYCNTVHTTAVRLAQQQSKLVLENRQLQTASSRLDFATDFLLSINALAEPIDIAENFAARWQKFYQTGLVCLYLAAPREGRLLKAVVIQSPSQTKTVCLNAPADIPVIPRAIANDFAIVDAQSNTDWLFEQLDVDFDLSRTKLVPLLSNGKTIGGIVFELRYPAETDQLEESFRTTTSIAGAVLGMAFAAASQQRFAEQFAQLVTGPAGTQPQTTTETPPKQTQTEIFRATPLTALAEMAGGAAHELNNPLSVISGRAQILAKSETDSEKKQVLKQIQENAGRLSAIIDDLMAFAQPPQPRPVSTDIKQLLDEATQLTAQKQNAEQLDIQTNISEALENAFVDSAQIASAIANIFSNSLESYDEGTGPIKVDAVNDESGDFVKLQTTDSGCGMDAETLKKATQPFFSARPAGRRRGMGLAHAQRIIELNNGSLGITSQPGKGTTVTILLPCK